MQKFELVLKNEKAGFYQTLLLLFIFLNFGFLLANAFFANEISVWRKTGIYLILATAALVAEYFLKKRNKKYNGKAVAVCFMMLIYVELSLWWPFAAVITFSILYLISARRLIVHVNPNWITYPSFPKKQLQWNSLNNIILKDGLLTIDFKNNRLAQAEVINGENDDNLDEKEFNEFCRKQLSIEH